MGKLTLVFFVIGPYLVTTINGFEIRLLILEVMLIQRIALKSRSIVWLLLALKEGFHYRRKLKRKGKKNYFSFCHESLMLAFPWVV